MSQTSELEAAEGVMGGTQGRERDTQQGLGAGDEVREEAHRGFSGEDGEQCAEHLGLAVSWDIQAGIGLEALRRGLGWRCSQPLGRLQGKLWVCASWSGAGGDSGWGASIGEPHGAPSPQRDVCS